MVFWNGANKKEDSSGVQTSFGCFRSASQYSQSFSDNAGYQQPKRSLIFRTSSTLKFRSVSVCSWSERRSNQVWEKKGTNVADVAQHCVTGNSRFNVQEFSIKYYFLVIFLLNINCRGITIYLHRNREYFVLYIVSRNVGLISSGYLSMQKLSRQS